jgi:hypothetical protein
VTPDNSYETCFTVWCWKDKNVFYSDNCHASGNLFGCVSLRRENYCILNKKYTKEEYEKLRGRIVEHMEKNGEWGEFFPSKSSPFCYNESLAQDFYPLTKKQAAENGYAWKDEDFRGNKPQKYKVPDKIKDVPEDILNELLACYKCSRNFKIMPLELKFYKKMGVAVPANCPTCRRLERQKRCSKMELWERNCDKCDKKITTVYPKAMGVKVYCEECYSKEIM